MKHSFLVIISLGLLTSCSAVGDIVNPADILLETSVKDWLHEQNGQVLTFRNAAGTAQTVYVRRRDEITSGAATKVSPVQIKTESITLVYSRLPVKLDSVSVVASAKNRLQFFDAGLPTGTVSDGITLRATIYTNNDHTQDSTDPATALLSNYPLGGHTYASVMRIAPVASWKGLAAPAALEELYYSRTDGLVGYKTLDGQLWTRP